MHKPSPQELADASKEELIVMLGVALTEQEKLDVTAKEARMSAAHYKLQHNLLTIETEEATKRMEVEHEMTRREVVLLQHATQDRGEPPSPGFLTKIRSYCESLEDENNQLLRRLKQAKKLMESQEDEIERLKEKNLQFKQRIRENREHLNTLRSPGGIFHSASPKTSSHSYPATPQQYRATPKQTPMTSRSARQVRNHSQEPFAALLLADRVLSQENNSEPSTPVLQRRTELPTTPGSRHNRAVQSMSSIPNIPPTARSGTAHSTLLPAVQFIPTIDRAARHGLTPPQPSRDRRRKSRDSTISASDTEELARAAMGAYRGESEEVHESQASQSATEMLRVDPRESFEVAASRTNTPTPITDKSSLLQSRILGPVTKSAAEKRKRVDEGYSREYSAKKVRSEDTVGLGIGYTPSHV